MRRSHVGKQNFRIHQAILETMERRTLFSALPNLTLDPTFGTGGIQHELQTNIQATPNVAAVNPVNGNIFIGGWFNFENHEYVEEFTANGSVVSSFGSNGAVDVLGNGAINSVVTDMAVQADGKLLVLSIQPNQPAPSLQTVYLLRFATAGKLDGTFGKGGIVSYPNVYADVSSNNGLNILPNGEIAVSSQANVSGQAISAVRLFTIAGKADTAFGTNGIATGISGALNGVTTDAEGNLIGFGSTQLIPPGGLSSNSNGNGLLERFTPAGKLDMTFGNGGAVINSATSEYEAVRLTSGVIQAAGILYEPVQSGGDVSDLFINEFDGNGSLVEGYGNQGTAGPIIPLQRTISCAYLPNGNLIVGLTAMANGSIESLARVNANGSLDQTFGNNGIAPSPYGNTGEFVLATDGKIVMPGPDNNGQMPPVRFNANGSPDTTLGLYGVAATKPLFTNGIAIIELSNGKSLVAGDLALSVGFGLYIQRRNSNGSIDSSFATGKGYEGASGYIFIGPFTANPGTSKLAIDSAGKIDLFSAGIGVLRFNADGSVDKTFGINGVAPNINATGFLLEPNGQILLATGSSTLARLNSNGQTDQTFGTKGTVTLPASFTQSDGILAVTSNASILIGGEVNETASDGTQNQDMALVKLKSNGSIDTTFGTNGITVADVLPETQQSSRSFYLSGPNAITQLANGTIVLEGLGGIGGPGIRNIGATIAEFLPNGSPNSSFGIDGQTNHFIGGGSYFGTGNNSTSLIVDPDGSLTVATTIPYGEGPAADTGLYLLHYTANGTVNDYVLKVASSDPINYLQPQAVQAVAVSSGKVLALTSTATPDDQGPYLAQYLTNATGSVKGTVYNDFSGNPANFKTPVAGQTIYADLNNNGKFDAGEPTEKSNSAGQYVLSGVPAGPQIIRDLLPTNERQSFPAGGSGQHVTVGLSPITGINFGVTTDIYLSGQVIEPTAAGPVMVYADLNGDGKHESNEPSVMTDLNGGFFFNSLSAGKYTIRIVAPVGYVQSIPVNGAGITLTLAGGGVNTHLAFTLVAVAPSATTNAIGSTDESAAQIFPVG